MSRPPLPQGALGSATWEALGTSISLRVGNGAALATARGSVEHELRAIDLACSRFRADSDLSRVNARAGRAVQTSQLMIEALELALRAAQLTDGDVDPTVGLALQLAGYDRDWHELARPLDGGGDPCGEGDSFAGSRAERPLATPRLRVLARVQPAWRSVRLDRANGSVRIPAGTALDLGATAKAWAADRAACAAAQAAGCGVLVSVGGDIATSGPCPAGGWQIRVTDDHRSDACAPGQTISIRSGGLATSSTAVRRWRHGGVTMHHIIDPATGKPVAGTWRTVSVAAASCADANIAATATMVRRQTATSWLSELGLPARLVAGDGTVTCIGDWPVESACGESA